MTVYLSNDGCKKFLKRTMATVIKKLCELNELQNNDVEKRKKILEELQELNNIIESINKYLDLIKLN